MNIIQELRGLIPKTAHEANIKQGEPLTTWRIQWKGKRRFRTICHINAHNPADAFSKALAKHGKDRGQFVGFRAPFMLEIVVFSDATAKRYEYEKRAGRPYCLRPVKDKAGQRIFEWKQSNSN